MSDQAANLRRKMEMSRSIKRAKTLAIVSGKGGVGKSNFALNFSMTMAMKNKKVLIFDLDIGMGNIDILMGLTPKKTIINLFDQNLSIHDIIELGPNSLSYVAAGSGLNQIFSLNEDKFDYFLSQLDELMSLYDYIIFDMGAGVTEESVHYILAVDECIVVTTPEPTSLTDAYSMIKHLTHKRFNLPMSLIVNKAPSQKIGLRTSQRLFQVVQQFIKKEVATIGILPDDSTVGKAVIRQTPFVLYAPKSSISLAMNRIVDQYVRDYSEQDVKETVPFTHKLKQFLKKGRLS
ncbi:MinD/ParA family protein [Aquibacillus kalidii]|uniref:MinD/ParA family protein n=1 Tax=Aquibacillus kalidii TaxID=2762597 RepID=UPI0016445541|nr:MinD/ParA family protein [Aquibacillus kalidii]